MVDPLFIEFVWNSGIVRKQIERVARTTNGTQKVNQEMLESIRVPNAPARASARVWAKSRAATLTVRQAGPCRKTAGQADGARSHYIKEDIPQTLFAAWGVHLFHGNLKHYYGLSGSGNWRMTFRITDAGNVELLDYVDYH